MTGNKSSRRKESDPVWRRMYLLGKIEGAKAKLMEEVSKMDAAKGAKDIDQMIAARFAPAVKAKRPAAKAKA